MANKILSTPGRKINTCIVEGCNKLSRNNKMCVRHDQQIKRYGEIRGNPAQSQKDPNIFIFKDNDCLISLFDKWGWKTGEAIINAEDFHLIKDKKWRLNSYGYVITGKRGKAIFLHWIILGERGNKKALCDHKDGNKLNNRKENLRYCIPSQNSMNRRPTRHAKSKYKGVALGKKNRWQASIMKKGNSIWLGYHINEQEAAMAYNKAAIKHFGEFACLNQIN